VDGDADAPAERRAGAEGNVDRTEHLLLLQDTAAELGRVVGSDAELSDIAAVGAVRVEPRQEAGAVGALGGDQAAAGDGQAGLRPDVPEAGDGAGDEGAVTAAGDRVALAEGEVAEAAGGPQVAVVGVPGGAVEREPQVGSARAGDARLARPVERRGGPAAALGDGVEVGAAEHPHQHLRSGAAHRGAAGAAGGRRLARRAVRDRARGEADEDVRRAEGRHDRGRQVGAAAIRVLGDEDGVRTDLEPLDLEGERGLQHRRVGDDDELLARLEAEAVAEGDRGDGGHRREIVSQEVSGNQPDPQSLIPLRAMAHPLRLRMLSLLTGAPLSATDLARELEIAHASASYHLSQLAEAGLVYPVPNEAPPAGGGRPPIRYRHDPAVGERLDRSEGRELAFAAMVEDVNRRLRALSRQRQVIDAEVWLEPQDWEEICALTARVGELLHGGARAPHAPGSVHASATLALFELEEPAAKPPTKPASAEKEPDR
jgi:DNA-binding transcriptional ArsR family regulator